jgi:hypothetical protein
LLAIRTNQPNLRNADTFVDACLDGDVSSSVVLTRGATERVGTLPQGHTPDTTRPRTPPSARGPQIRPIDAACGVVYTRRNAGIHLRIPGPDPTASQRFGWERAPLAASTEAEAGRTEHPSRSSAGHLTSTHERPGQAKKAQPRVAEFNRVVQAGRNRLGAELGDTSP